MRAVVLDASYGPSLAIIRSLGKMGIDVIAVEYPERTRMGVAGFHSRYTKQRLVVEAPWNDPNGFRAALQTFQNAVLFPVAIQTVKWLIEQQNTLPVHALLPKPVDFHLANDKALLAHLARRVGVSTPVIFPELQDAEFPCVVKYRNGEVLGLPPQKRYQIVQNREELERAYGQFSEQQSNPLVQEYLPGAGIGYTTVFDAHHRPLGEMVHQRLREYPSSGGPSCYATVVDIPDVVDRSRILLEALHWVGPAMVEFKTALDGTLRLLEINPRFWGSLPLATFAGFDAPLLYYQSALGLETRSVPPRIGAKIRFLLKDFLSSRASKMSITRYLTEYLSTPDQQDAIFSLQDPMPAVVYLWRQFIKGVDEIRGRE